MKQRKRVLIIEDSYGMRELLSNVLTLEGYQTIMSPTMEDAELDFDNSAFDLVVSDIFMPGKGGIEGISEMREGNPEIKIIAISGGWQNMNSEMAVSAAKKIGADAALAKPFEPDDLVSMVHDLIGSPVR